MKWWQSLKTALRELKEDMFPPPVICAVCKGKKRHFDLAVAGVCLDCWYSDDEAVQDKAWDMKDEPVTRAR